MFVKVIKTQKGALTYKTGTSSASTQKIQNKSLEVEVVKT